MEELLDAEQAGGGPTGEGGKWRVSHARVWPVGTSAREPDAREVGVAVRQRTGIGNIGLGSLAILPGGSLGQARPRGGGVRECFSRKFQAEQQEVTVVALPFPGNPRGGRRDFGGGRAPAQVMNVEKSLC
jgi:hypothetical protein